MNINFSDDNKNKMKKPHGITLQNRNQMNVTGVLRVENFNEYSICLATEFGLMTVEGENLHISKLLLETGDLIIDGRISSLFYTEENESENGKKAGGFFSKLLK